jgi:hypothetical protein
VCYRLPEMESHWKWIVTTSLAQQLVLPWVTAIWIAMGATLANFGHFDVIGLSLATLLVGILCARKAVHYIELPGEQDSIGPVSITLAFVYTLGVLIVTALTYGLFRQSSCYSRVSSHAARGQDVDSNSQEARMPTMGSAVVSVPP